MNICEYCGKRFPSLAKLYRHKYDMHREKSLVLHSHGSNKQTKELSIDSPNDSYLPESDLESEHVAIGSKRPREEDDDEADDDVGRRKKKPRRKLFKPKAIKEIEFPSKALEIPNQVEAVKEYPESALPQIEPNKQNDSQVNTNIPNYENVDYKTKYEDCLAELKVREENLKQKFKKECMTDILKIKKKFHKIEKSLKKQIAMEKKHAEETTKEIKDHYENNIRILKEKIKSMEGEDDFKTLSEAVFNCITMEEIFRIRRLIKEQKIEELLDEHLGTLQKLFLSMSYGVIPLCQPQRDVISDNQRKLIEKIETSDREEAKKLIMENKMEIINLFSIIELSLQPAGNSYKKFLKI